MAGLLRPDTQHVLTEFLLRHPVGPLVIPAFRVAPERLAPAAEAAAHAASALLARDVAGGARLGLEAHYLYAFVRQEIIDGRLASDARIEASCVTWCRLLADLAVRIDASGDSVLARDLASWGVTAFLILDPYNRSPDRAAALEEPTAVFEHLGAL